MAVGTVFLRPAAQFHADLPGGFRVAVSLFSSLPLCKFVATPRAGALSGVLSQFSIRYGPGIQPLLAIMAGLLSLLVWLLKLERFFVFIPSAVMHGFTLGVAFIIAVNQLNFALGLPKLPRHEAFVDNVLESLKNVDQTSWLALLFFIGAFGSLYLLQRKYGKIPWSIVLAFVGIIIGAWQGENGPIATIRSRYGDLEMQLVQVSDIFSKGVSASFAEWVHIFTGSVSVALIAVLETLISAHIADRMTKTLFNQPREVLGVGLANLASGLAGGVPATAALARTALNVKSGATSRASGIVNGISIIILSTVLFGLFKYLPLPVVAAILVSVALRMVEWPEIRQLYAMDKPMFAVAVIVGLVCILEDPTLGIIAGALLGQIRVLMSMRDGHAGLNVYKGRTCLMASTVAVVDAKKAVAAAGVKFAAEVTPQRVAAAANADEEGAAALVAAAKLAAVKAANGAVSLRASDGRRPSAVDADIITIAPSPSRDAALPLLALYTFPGYFTFVSAQVHRDRLRALFMEGAVRAMPGVKTVVFSLTDSHFADPDALETVGTLVEELRRAGYEVFLLGFKPQVFRAASKVHHLADVRTFGDFHGLLRFLRRQVGSDGVYVPAGPLEHAHGHGHDAAAAAAHAGSAAAPAVAGVPVKGLLPGGDADGAGTVVLQAEPAFVPAYGAHAAGSGAQQGASTRSAGSASAADGWGDPTHAPTTGTAAATASKAVTWQ